MNILDILELVVQKEGSDIHLITGSPPMLRVTGKLETVPGVPALNHEQATVLIEPLMTKEQKDYLKVNKEIDFAYQYKNKGRFRINVYHQKGEISASLRLIPAKIKTIADLQLPEIFHKFTQYKQGLVLITGPTGEGKSTTLASMIEEINETRGEHILTIEDPIEFVYTPKKKHYFSKRIEQRYS